MAPPTGGRVLRPRKRKRTSSLTTSSSIRSLPHEVLSMVISHAPAHVQELRLVCRGFRDCAWPTFGASFEDTNFDIRSIESMKALKAMAENENLAPHVKNLTFTTGFVERDFPGLQLQLPPPASESDDYISDMDDGIYVSPEEFLDSDVIVALEEYHSTTAYWFADAWNWTPCMADKPSSLEMYAILSSKQNIVDFLAMTLSKFNLHAIKYELDVYPRAIADLRQLVIDEAEENGVMYDEHSSSEKTAINLLGVDIILQSLAAGNIAVKDLSIPVIAQYCYALFSLTPSAIWEKVLSNVKTLTTISYDPGCFLHHVGPGHELMLTASRAPKLEHLLCTQWLTGEVISSDIITQNLPLVTYPPLRHLELPAGARNNADFDAPFFDFLSKVGTTLKTLKFYVPFRSNWAQLVTFLAKSVEVRLETLTIDTISASCQFERFYGNGEIPAKEVLYAAAETVVLVESNFGKWLEKKWAAQNDG